MKGMRSLSDKEFIGKGSRDQLLGWWHLASPRWLYLLKFTEFKLCAFYYTSNVSVVKINCKELHNSNNMTMMDNYNINTMIVTIYYNNNNVAIMSTILAFDTTCDFF